MAGEGNKGWISIYRTIGDGWLWEDKPFARGQAWVDLLLQANHKDNKVFSKGELVDIKRGSLLTSDQLLAERWGWSRKKVRTFLTTLEKEQMITLARTSKGTSLTIAKYSFYQDKGTTEDTAEIEENMKIGFQKGTPKGTAKDTSLTIDNQGFCHDEGTAEDTTEDTTEEQRRVQQKNTNNNYNNVNNDNKYIYSSEANEYRLAVYLFNFIKRNNEKAKEPNLQSWAKDFDKLLRIDNRDLEEVKQVIKFCQNDSFWFANVLSPKKLREKYEQLLLKMKNERSGQNNFPSRGNGLNSNGKHSTFNDHTQRPYDGSDGGMTISELEKKLLGWDNSEE